MRPAPATACADLAVRAESARARLAACDLCIRDCRVNRLRGETGVCGLDARTFWFREMLIYGIEMELIPAHAIYLTGCNIRCAYCNVSEWNADPARGEPWDAARMAQRVAARREEGAETLLILGGEPTLQPHAILDLLARTPERGRVALDSNMLFAAPVRELFRGVVEVYVADLKFGNDACAQQLAEVPHYLAVLRENLAFAEETSRLIVRHLMVPGHLECCTLPALAWLRRHVAKPRLALKWEYLPPPSAAQGSPLGTYVSRQDYARAKAAAQAAGIELVD